MPALVITGAQWGDEGKGKLVDNLTSQAHWVVRFQGGNNAGHTLVVNGVKTKLQLVPCGILRPQARCLIGAGVVASPSVLVAEINGLRSSGVQVTPERLVIDRDAHLVMEYHPAIDRAREERLGKNRIGTTGRGIGPAYEDRAGRCGVRFADLLSLDAIADSVRSMVEDNNAYLKNVLGSSDSVQFSEVWAALEAAAHELGPFVGNGSLLINRALRSGERVVFEGAQAAMLDQTFGTVPYVTSSSTIAGAVCTGCGIGPKLVDYVLGVAKAYTTRVGSGPFPTELHDSVGDGIRARGAEFGTVTGRPRRCGWLDIVQLKRAIRLNGYDSIALMKLDVLSGVETLKIGLRYLVDGREQEDVPALAAELAGVTVEYEEMPGWRESLDGITSWRDVPSAARRYVERIEQLLEVPVSVVSIGAERAATLFLDSSRYLRNFSEGGGDVG